MTMLMEDLEIAERIPPTLLFWDAVVNFQLVSIPNIESTPVASSVVTLNTTAAVMGYTMP